MFANHYKLDNFILIIDRNKLCILGKTEDCIKLENLDAKFEAFGFEVFIIDGHSYKEIDETMHKIKQNHKPKVIIAQTTKAKGISFMENGHLWHNKIPTEKEFKVAKNEIKNLKLGE